MTVQFTHNAIRLIGRGAKEWDFGGLLGIYFAYRVVSRISVTYPS